METELRKYGIQSDNSSSLHLTIELYEMYIAKQDSTVNVQKQFVKSRVKFPLLPSGTMNLYQILTLILLEASIIEMEVLLSQTVKQFLMNLYPTS